MSALPDESVIARFLGRVARREALLRALEGAAAGAVVGATVAMALNGIGAQVLAVVATALVGLAMRLWLGDRWSPGWWRNEVELAGRIEARTPAFRNLLVTSAELGGGAGRGNPLRSLVIEKASLVAGQVDVAQALPARSRWLAFGAALVVAGAAMAFGRVEGRGFSSGRTSAVAGASIDGIDAIIVPPAYLGLATDTVRNPDRIEVVAGSSLRLVVRSNAPSLRLERVAGEVQLVGTDDVRQAELVAQESDVLAFSAMDDSGRVVARRMIGLAVTADAEPVVRLTSPARDLFVPEAPDRVAIAARASDDHALASLTMKYTVVSGSGEQFTFTELEQPLSVARASDRSWTGRADWRLDTLRLTAGDMIVYRAVSSDRRPGAAPAQSDSYVLEIVGPGAVAAEGFATDDERDRYAVSQQMVILRTERLIAARSRLPEGAVADSSRVLAAEQRRVRAEFVFMMGGELADDDSLAGTLMVDEHAESEAEDDVLAGRMQNRGRLEMTRALRAMSAAASKLTQVGLPNALSDEKRALDNLMRAFSRSRILLRALTQRERLDLDRRLSGSLAEASPATRAVPEPPDRARLRALRGVLATVATHSSGSLAPEGRAELAAAAIALVRVDPADDSLRVIAAAIESAAGEASPGSALQEPVLRLAAHIRELVPRSSGRQEDHRGDRLRGAVADALDSAARVRR